MKISIVVDSSDSWFVKHAKKLQNILKKKHDVNFSYGVENIIEGDVAFFLSFTSICPPETLKLNESNVVIHASDLPKGKGWSPMPWQIIEGKKEIVLSLFEMVDKIDSGDVYIKDRVFYAGHELIDELRDKMAEKIIDMAVNYVENYEEISPIKQKGEETYYEKRTPKYSELDIEKTLNEQFNLLRTVDNEKYPAFFYKNGVKYLLKIYKDT